MEFTQEDYDAVAAAIRAAEARTSGQIVCVLAHASSDYAYVPFLSAGLLALLAPWPMIYLTAWSVQQIYFTQLLIFIAVALVLSWPRLRFALVPHAARKARAHRAALEQFVLRRVAHTKNRSGVLIFVSLAERYARIVADDAVAEKVPVAEWQGAIDALVGHMRGGRVADGFVAAIERCGAVLAAHAPPDGSRDSLPDRVYVV